MYRSAVIISEVGSMALSNTSQDFSSGLKFAVQAHHKLVARFYQPRCIKIIWLLRPNWTKSRAFYTKQNYQSRWRKVWKDWQLRWMSLKWYYSLQSVGNSHNTLFPLTTTLLRTWRKSKMYLFSQESRMRRGWAIFAVPIFDSASPTLQEKSSTTFDAKLKLLHYWLSRR